MSKHSAEPISMFDMRIMRPALIESFKKLDPRELWRNPVMLCVEIASVITLVTFVMSLTGANLEPAWFTGLVSVWLWLTVLFATFAEALAEGRGKAQADSLRRTRRDTPAYRLRTNKTIEEISSAMLKQGDRVVVEAARAHERDQVTGRRLDQRSLVDHDLRIRGDPAAVLPG